MKVVQPYVEIVSEIDSKKILEKIELCGRVCYKSEDKITNGSAVRFAQSLVKRGHESVIEHAHVTVRFVCDRGVSHELVRHRVASISQESTRYVLYGDDRNEVTFIEPCFWNNEGDRDGDKAYAEWYIAMTDAERRYKRLIECGAAPEEARTVLPHSLKTEVVMTANLREWRHILNLRCAKAAHPQMREVMLMLLEKLYFELPIVFDDIYEKYREEIDQ